MMDVEKVCPAGNKMNIRYCNMFSGKWILNILRCCWCFFFVGAIISCVARSFPRLNDECMCALTESDVWQANEYTLVFWLQFIHFHVAQIPALFCSPSNHLDDRIRRLELCSDFVFLFIFFLSLHHFNTTKVCQLFSLWKLLWINAEKKIHTQHMVPIEVQAEHRPMQSLAKVTLNHFALDL